jgi:hypothetical protein
MSLPRKLAKPDIKAIARARLSEAQRNRDARDAAKRAIRTQKWKDLDIASRALRQSRVHPVCVQIWKNMRAAQRWDTFIGLVDTRTFIYYIAPCFGVDYQVVEACVEEKGEKFSYPPGTQGDIGRGRYLLARGFFPDKTPCSSNSTSVEGSEAAFTEKGQLDRAYKSAGFPPGFNPVVYVGLGEPRSTTKYPLSFDGKSHQAMLGWLVNQNMTFEIAEVGFWKNALGFAIQRDRTGYYVRYSSALNVEQGQPAFTLWKENPAEWRIQHSQGNIEFATFAPPTPKPPAEAGGEAKQTMVKELRDLPKQWAELIENTLARDLRLAVLKPRVRTFGWQVSRSCHDHTKYSRLAFDDDEQYAYDGRNEGDTDTDDQYQFDDQYSLNNLTYRSKLNPGTIGSNNSLL